MLGTIIVALLEALYGELRRPLTIVETGTLRDRYLEEGCPSEQRSTLAIAQWMQQTAAPHMFYSLDCNARNLATSRMVLSEAGLLDLVIYREGDSAARLRELPDGIDFALLDSANEPAIILGEYFALRPKLNREAIIVIDDCFKQNMGVNKGALALPEAMRDGFFCRGISHVCGAIATGKLTDRILTNAEGVHSL